MKAHYVVNIDIWLSSRPKQSISEGLLRGAQLQKYSSETGNAKVKNSICLVGKLGVEGVSDPLSPQKSLCVWLAFANR